jgi:hypothetical protein
MQRIGALAEWRDGHVVVEIWGGDADPGVAGKKVEGGRGPQEAPGLRLQLGMQVKKGLGLVPTHLLDDWQDPWLRVIVTVRSDSLAV